MDVGHGSISAARHDTVETNVARGDNDRCPLVVMGQLNNTYIHKINAELARCRVAQLLALVLVVFKENTVWQILKQRSTRIKESHEHV
jgi:hypothetical protein